MVIVLSQNVQKLCNCLDVGDIYKAGKETIDRVLRKFSRELNYKIPHQEQITEVNKNLEVSLFYRRLSVIIGSTAN